MPSPFEVNRMRFLSAGCAALIACLVSLNASCFAQQSQESDQKAYARSAKDIPFQNDSQWEDNRWQQTDVGPFLAATMSTHAGNVLKGLAIRVGDRGQAAVCFDTVRMQLRAGWTGGFLTFGPRRFGLIRPPRADGKPFFAVAATQAGWALGERFEPRPDEITQPDVERGYARAGATETGLPRKWAHFGGHYTHGRRVVLSYTVGATQVLESPWYVSSGEADAFVRWFEVAPSDRDMHLWMGDPQVKNAIIDSNPTLHIEPNRPVLRIAPRDQTVRFGVLIARSNATPELLQALKERAGAAPNLAAMTSEDEGRFPEQLHTTGETTTDGGPYVVDTMTLPFENPWNALLFTAGHDFFSNGTAAICTAHGDVWTVAGIDRDLDQLTWRRFATGLCQPLGLRIVDDRVYVVGRNQITRLHDRNADGEADFYENFNNDAIISMNAHDYVTCLDTGPDGSFYYIHARTGVMQVARDGSSSRSIADGFRNPNGMGVSPTGVITAAPQQGQWTPESSLIVVREGGYYGFGGPRVTPDRQTGWDLPMCFIPRELDNSGGGQVWVEGDRWGPLKGQMLHLSYGQCRLLLALTEQSGSTVQGGTIAFPTVPRDFAAGIMRGRFSPHDGQLYVSGLRGWQTRAVRDGCFQRVRYTGGAVHLPVAVRTYTNGIALTFSETLDRDTAENPENYFVEQWNYRWTAAYGSPQYSVENPEQQGRDEVDVVSATLQDDQRTVFLELPGRQPVHQITIDWLLRSADGQAFRGKFAHTINSPPSETVPESQLHRRQRQPLLAVDVEARLQPGLEFQFRHPETGESDARVSRLAALQTEPGAAATPFLEPGAFHLHAAGTIKVPRSGFYQFRIESPHKGQVWLGDQLIADSLSQAETLEPVLVRKGHNPIRMQLRSGSAGDARFRLFWKGYNFAWEPIPPGLLFHDSGSQELQRGQQRRTSRNLFAAYACHRCHKSEIETASLFELSLPAPDLAGVGDRLDAAWLAAWIRNPTALRPGTTMPAVVSRHAEVGSAEAAHIAAFLSELSADDPRTEDAAGSENADEGARLFESLGCLSCHHFEVPPHDDEYDRVSLHYAAAKYQPDALTAFLLQPDRHDPATEMPNFQLTAAEAASLSRFVRSQSKGKAAQPAAGNAVAGRRLFDELGCRQCHAAGEKLPRLPPKLSWPKTVQPRGCLAPQPGGKAAPRFGFDANQQQALARFVNAGLDSLRRSVPQETSRRLVQQLRCSSCHDRDSLRSHRTLVLSEEGSGRTPETIPGLTWAGEKLSASWTRALLAGEHRYQSRPWLEARMPAFPAYAHALAAGLAAEHAVPPGKEAFTVDRQLAKVGEQLTRQTGLDCRQCHGIGEQKPRGDKNTKIALGINLSLVKHRLREDAYHRFMMDPARFDSNTRMIKLSEDGVTTRLKAIFDADARRQFDAVWHYIRSLPD